MEKRNEPLLLRPAGKDYLWGGKRLNDEYGKNIELSPLAETWECSTHPDGVSTVCCGTFDKMELTAVIKPTRSIWENGIRAKQRCQSW